MPQAPRCTSCWRVWGEGSAVLRSLLKGGWDLKWGVWGCRHRRDVKLLAWESIRAGRRLGWVLQGNLVPAGSDVLLPGELSQVPGGKEGQH